MVVLNSLRVLRCIDEERSEFVKWTKQDHRADLAGQYRQITKLVPGCRADGPAERTRPHDPGGGSTINEPIDDADLLAAYPAKRARGCGATKRGAWSGQTSTWSAVRSGLTRTRRMILGRGRCRRTWSARCGSGGCSVYAVLRDKKKHAVGLGGGVRGLYSVRESAPHGPRGGGARSPCRRWPLLMQTPCQGGSE